MERVYGGHLCYGPPIEGGFYYDFFTEEHRVSEGDFKVLDDVCKKIVKEKQPFERLEMKKSDLLEMFKYNQASALTLIFFRFLNFLFFIFTTFYSSSARF